MTKQRHECDGPLPELAYGPAIEWCVESDGSDPKRPVDTLWAENAEYASQVNYCPYCGAKAPTQVAEKEHE